MSELYTVNEGRAYIHKTCGTTTVVSGKDFAGLCNPFAPCLGTICVKCGPDSTKNFTWEDTGESVSSFRRRVRRASPILTAWSWIVAPVIGAVVGGMAMLAFKAPNVSSEAAAAIGAVAGAAVMAFIIAPVITGIIAGRRFYDQQ